MKSEPRCSICGEQQSVFMESISDPESGEVFSILQCAGCGLQSTAPVPENLGDYYPGNYYGNRHGWTARVCARRRLHFLHCVSTGRGSGAVLDFGCGNGAFMLAAKSAGWGVMGTEINAPALTIDAPVYADLADVPENTQLDCMTFWHTLEHVVDPRKTLIHAVERLAPDGILLIAVPNAGGVQAKLFGRHWLHRDVPRHLHHFNESSIGELLESVDFVVFRRWASEWEYDWMGWVQSLLNAMGFPVNAFFDQLRGVPAPGNAMSRGLRFGIGCVVTALAAPLLLIDLLTPYGGTLIVAARKKQAGTADEAA